MADMEEKRRVRKMGNRGRMNSSFSSISFEAESAKRFKQWAKEQDKTHTELLDELMVCSKYDTTS